MPFAKCRLGDGLADAFGAAQNGAASVSQTSVSLAAGMLQKAGIVHYQHGRITIVDRVGLEGGSRCVLQGRGERISRYDGGRPCSCCGKST